MPSNRIAMLTAAALVASATAASFAAAPVYSDDFDSGMTDSVNYNVYASPGSTGASSDAIFGFDYSTLGIPSAPHSVGGSTIGVHTAVDDLQASTNPPNVLGALTVATKNVPTLTTPYVVQVDVWGNYIGTAPTTANGVTTPGSIAGSGTNGTTAAGFAIGTAGTGLVSPNGSDGALFETFHDGGNSSTSNSDYRAYVGTGTPGSYTTNATNAANTTGYYAAGTSTTDKDNSNSFYTNLFPSVTAPGVEQTNYPSTQGGSTPAGIIGFRWTTWTITNDGTNVTWAITPPGATTPTVIATVPLSAYKNFGGNQVAFGSIDSGLTGAYDVNSQLLNADIFDNLSVTITPEPATLTAVAGLGGLMIRRRRSR